MLAYHYTIEFAMIFLITFLINHHFQLTQENEALRKCCQSNDKCQNPQVERTCPKIQSSTMPGLLMTSSPSLLSHQEHGVYWIDGNTFSGSVQHVRGIQSQSAASLISSSYPPDFVVNPSETSTIEIKHFERDIGKSRFDEVETVFITETESIIIDHIPVVESSEKTFFHVPEDSEHSRFTNFSSSSNNGNIPLHSPTSSPSVKVRQSEGSEKNENYYTLPVEQTLTSAGPDDEQKKTFADFPALTSENEIFVKKHHDKLDVPKTSIHSKVRREVMYTKTFAIPLPSSTPSTIFLKAEDSMAISTKAQDENDLESNVFESSYTNNLPSSPHKPYPSHLESLKGDNEIREQPQDDELHSILSNGNSVSISGGSSARCIGNERWRKYCIFHNICYNTQKKDFIFFKGSDSVIESDLTQDMNNVFTLSLSTLSEHNALLFSLVTLPVEALSNFSMSVISKKSVAITRFKPDNLMHVLHDDILPLHHSLRQFNFPQKAGMFDAVIVFTDSYDAGDYYDLYKSLSHIKPLALKDFTASHEMICFTDIHVGLLTSTIWYQYGFDKPQGPLPDVNIKASYHIQEAAQYIAEHFKTDCFQCQQKNSLVLLSRKDNRLILNEGELILALSRATRLKVLSVSLETQSLGEIITIVRSSRGIIGMHGSLISLAIFLPPGGVLIELYPFAVNPSRYTPFKSFTELPGSHLAYASWVNSDRGQSISHPDWLPQEGGIHHLPTEVQKEIENQMEVPEHLCCNDPSWLYHIYQDTHVNVSAVVSLTLKALEAQSPTSPQTQLLKTVPNMPGSVENLLCERRLDKGSEGTEKTFTVSWNPHWALKYHSSPEKLRHEIVMQQKGSDESSLSNLSIDVFSYSFDSSYESDEITYNVWITVIEENGTRSHSQFISCQ